MMSKHTVINFLLFMLLWPVAVYGSLEAEWLGTSLAWALLCVHALAASDSAEKVVVFSTATWLFGWLFESMMAILGLLDHGTGITLMGVPVWILSLWHGLGLTLTLSNRWLIHGPLLAVGLWLLLVPVTYLTAAKLGAITIEKPLISSVLITLFWALMVGLMRYLERRLEQQLTGKELAS